MSMHKKPLTPLEEEGLRVHHLPIGVPSQLSDSFRIGMAWAQRNSQTERELNVLASKLGKVRDYCQSNNIGEWGSFCTEELIKHCDALVAQVAAYKERSSQLNKLCDELIDHLRYNKAERDEVLNKFWAKQEAIKNVPTDPSKCLAHVKASAIEQAIEECLSANDDTAAIRLIPMGYLLSEKWLLHYAEKVRRGDE